MEVKQEPPSTGGRIILIDALRGFALLGIIIMHFFHWFIVGPLPGKIAKKDYGQLSKITEFIDVYFITGKFFILFSFIFGMSFYLQTISFKKYAQNVDLLFYRRAFFLFVIGILHYLIWFGDILFLYALMMIPLIYLRKLSDKWLLFIGIFLVLNVPGMLLWTYHSYHFHPVAAQQNTGEENPLVMQLYNIVANGSIWDLIRYDIGYIHPRFQYQVWGGSLFMIPGFFVLGMLTARKRLLLRIQLLKDKFIYIIPACIILLYGLQTILNPLDVPEKADIIPIKMATIVITFLQSITAIILFICLMAVLLYNKVTLALTRYLADVGRMALTNYILQTVIGMLLFYHFGLGLYNNTTPGTNFFIAIGVFIFQLLFSNIWFRYFNYGIIEWLLRAGTLWEFKDLRKRNLLL